MDYLDLKKNPYYTIQTFHFSFTSTSCMKLGTSKSSYKLVIHKRAILREHITLCSSVPHKIEKILKEHSLQCQVIQMH